MNIPIVSPIRTRREVPTLQEIARISCAVLISNLDQIKRMCENINSHINCEFVTPDMLSNMAIYPDERIKNEFKLEAVNKLKDICIPKIVKAELADCLCTIYSDTFKFLNINYVLLFETLDLKTCIVLYSNGSINQRESLRRIINNPNLSCRIKFASAYELRFPRRTLLGY
ncbi:hypothetical protein HNY73_010462 [Argiope bruennichi]|uniref:Uncharacterized protein n=1 Tax=Argiope bruennichi TaxID=94029 RepID=A0A8T0F3I3_ARGBR|nr:hypothetical protein HNY73_010462 [Argiope bruennichi]